MMSRCRPSGRIGGGRGAVEYRKHKHAPYIDDSHRRAFYDCKKGTDAEKKRPSTEAAS